MNHTRIHPSLLEALDNPLQPLEERRLRSHVATCEECRRWLATFELLAGGLAPQSLDGPAEAHLSSDEIVAFSLERKGLSTHGRRRSGAHLLRCESCAQEADLVRAAAEDTQPNERVVPMRERSRRMVPVGPWRLAWAAALIVGLGLGLATIAFGPRRIREVEGVRNVRVEGTRSFRAGSLLTVESADVEPGASLTLTSGHAVVLGDGFTIKNGASVGVYLSAGDS